MSANLANGDATVENELMNEVDWDGDMLDSRSDCICVENVDARLAVDVEWHRTDAWRGKPRKDAMSWAWMARLAAVNAPRVSLSVE